MDDDSTLLASVSRLVDSPTAKDMVVVVDPLAGALLVKLEIEGGLFDMEDDTVVLFS